MHPVIPFAARVNTNSAPNALIKTLLSKLICSGITIIHLLPFLAHINAKPTPVLPDVLLYGVSLKDSCSVWGLS